MIYHVLPCHPIIVIQLSLTPSMPSPKIAVVHEWLVDHSGSEKVLEQILRVYPDADLFSVVEFLPDDLKYYIQHKKVTTTFVQRLPFARKHYRNYLPLMPLAVEQLDVSAYDIVISNSHAVAKGVITSSDQLHLCYCHSPIRYAWDLYHQYLREAGLTRGIKGFVAKVFLHYLRQWDLSTVNRIDHFMANSRYIAQRISKVYRRDATVVYPPIDVAGFALRPDKENFFLAASRFVPYKRMDLIVRAFRALPDQRLVVIGDGPDFAKAKAEAGDNVELLGFQPFEVLKDYMQRAQAFVFAADGDFGMIPVEAQACGTPVIAYRKGGVLETVVEDQTGVFFDQQEVEAIVTAVRRFSEKQGFFVPATIRAHAESFSEQVFRSNLRQLVEQTYQNFLSNKV